MTVGIVGLGLIGGSIGLSLRRPGWTIIGYDQSEEASTIALQRQCVDELKPIEEVSQAEVVFVASPPKVTIGCLELVFKYKAEATIVTDCASYKGAIVEFARQANEPKFIAGHPMAGHEKSGAAFASAWMFKHANWILSPLKNVDKAALKTLEEVVRQTGAKPVRLDAGTHDEQVALLSHLPHVVAGALVRMGDKLDHTHASAGSWKDLTRVGGVDPTLWSQIMTGNRQPLLKVIDEFESELAQVKAMLTEENEAELKRYLVEAAQAKKRQQPEKPAPVARPARKTR